MDICDLLDDARRRTNVLEHPFYCAGAPAS